MMVINVEPTAIKMLVRRPAGLPTISRSKPIAPPNRTAMQSLPASCTSHSHVPMRNLRRARAARRQLAPESAFSRIDRALSQCFLDAQQLVVFRRALTTRERSGLDLARVAG